MQDERRRVLVVLGGLATGAGLAACGGAQAHAASGHGDDADDGVTAPEDLMREHGVLRRVLLVYDEAARRLTAGEALDATLVVRAANIIRHFVEDYHERSEERFVFPPLLRVPEVADTVRALLAQHERGRQVTDAIIRRASSAPSGATATELATLLTQFNRMYRPHAAREDSVIFPALRATIGRRAVDALGEQMEQAEHQTVGEGGFERAVADVATIERAMGLYDLAQFTPPAPSAT